MSSALTLTLALLLSVLGLAWFALAMDVHWRQVRGRSPLSRRAERALRALGAVALGVSLLLCLRVDHGSMAPLVWVMSLAGASLVVALILTWRPRWLTPLVFWLASA